jgi:hypothetical protein
MQTDVNTDEAREEAEFLERLRAAGVKLATGELNRPRVIVKQRPRWLAFLVRTLRLDRD